MYPIKIPIYINNLFIVTTCSINIGSKKMYEQLSCDFFTDWQYTKLNYDFYNYFFVLFISS